MTSASEGTGTSSRLKSERACRREVVHRPSSRARPDRCRAHRVSNDRGSRSWAGVMPLMKEARSRFDEFLCSDTNERVAAFSCNHQLSPRFVRPAGAQLLVTGDEIEIRRKPPHGQIAQQPVDEPCAAIEVSIELVARGNAGAVPSREERKDHALDADATLVQLPLVF